jgi:hypothetical protein
MILSPLNIATRNGLSEGKKREVKGGTGGKRGDQRSRPGGGWRGRATCHLDEVKSGSQKDKSSS